MADEHTQDKPAAPAIDPEALKTMVEGAVKTSLDAVLARAKQEQDELAAVAAATKDGEKKAASAGQDVMGELIRPHLESTLKAAKDAETRALLAADAATFYTDPGMAEALPYRAKIEEVVAVHAKKGVTVGRVDAWKWLRGGELYEDIDKARQTARQKKEEDAKYATAAGAGSVRGGGQQMKPIETQTTDELTKTLEGMGARVISIGGRDVTDAAGTDFSSLSRLFGRKDH